jgi:GNAT superfamily N-acetyltransferase
MQMNNITIVEVNTKKQMLDFVKFPFELYKDHPFWVPPLIQEELETFNKKINPAFDQAEAKFYLAYKNSKIVGRVVAIVNWVEVKEQKKSKVRFGWFDVIDDVNVTKVLLETVANYGKSFGLTYMEGPMGFSNLDKVGVLTECFDQIGTMITWYNYPYYKTHFESLGMVKEKEYYEGKFSFDAVDPKPFERVDTIVRKKYNVRVLNFTKNEDIMPYVDQMFDLFNTSYANLASFIPVSERQKAYFKKKYIGFMNPEYIKFVLDSQNKLVGFSIVMPAFAKALQKANGKLFPLGFYHLLKAKKQSKDVIFYLIGIAPEYQSKGLTAVLFHAYHNVFKERKIENCIRTPELEENNAIHNLWKNFPSLMDRRRRTYKIDIK